jgi:hypothetical protein
LVLIQSCGYTISSGIRKGIKTIYIATFENKTFEHAIEVRLSKILSREFILDGSLSIVDSSKADIILNGEIVEYIMEPYTYGASEKDVEQYRILIRANVSLKDVSKDEVLWEENLIEGDATYYTGGAMAGTEEKATERALYELSKRIIDRTIRGW